MPKPFVFIYLPKTGSTPLIAHLARHLVWNERIVYLGPWGDRQRHREGRPDISAWSPGKLRKIHVLTGPDIDMSAHEVAGADEGRYLTVLRDPAELLVAEYNALLETGAPAPEFWTWYEARRVNQTTRRFRKLFGVETADEISERLDKFWYLTTTDHLAEDAPHIFREIGVPEDWDPGIAESDLDDTESDDTGEIRPVPAWEGERLQMTDDIRARIYSDHPKDRRLYKRALKRRQSKRRRFGWD